MVRTAGSLVGGGSRDDLLDFFFAGVTLPVALPNIGLAAVAPTTGESPPGAVSP